MKKDKKKKYSIEADSEPVEALSYEELRMLKNTIERGEDRSKKDPYDTSEKAKLRRSMKKNKLVTVSVIIIALAFLAGLVFVGVWAVSPWINRPNTSEFTIELGEERPYTVPYDDMVRDGVLYVDLEKIAEFSNLIVSGSRESLQFTSRSGSFLRFDNGSEIARINGRRVEMQVTEFRGSEKVLAKAVITENECFVPYSFLKMAVTEGLLFRFNDKTNTLSLKKVFTQEMDKNDNPIAVKLVFATDHFTELTDPTAQPQYEYSYLIDIEPYLASITTENLLLANKEKPLGSDFVPSVVELTCKVAENRTMKLSVDAAKALEAMMLEMEAAGIDDIYVTSAYRSYDRQYTLYYETYYYQEKMKHPDWTDEQIFAEVSTYSAKPGTSEHQTGLCVDFMTSAMSDLNNQFETTAAFAWLRQNAYKFGFVLRYDKTKVDITGYSYESWHYRFVGRDAATEMYFADQCLEEYLESQGN